MGQKEDGLYQGSLIFAAVFFVAALILTPYVYKRS